MKRQQILKLVSIMVFVGILAGGSYYLYHYLVKVSPYLNKKPMHEQTDTTGK